MNEYGIIIVAIGLAGGLFFYFKGGKFGGSSSNCPYVTVDDPNAQTNYEKSRPSGGPSLSAKELLDLSWKFLYSITEAVLHKFSSASREEVHRCGSTLAEHGMRYVHVVEAKALIQTSSRAKDMLDKVEDGHKQVQR